MVSDFNFKSGMSLIFSTFPHLKPAENADFVLKVWHKAFNKLTDEQFVSAISDFAINTKKLYPSDNWVAMVLDSQKPKISETVGDVVEQILDVLGSVSFVYFDEDSRKKLNELKIKSPIAYAVGNRLGWAEMAKTDNVAVLRGQIRVIAEEEINRANRIGSVILSANSDEVIDVVSQINRKLLR